jgi:uncharacterized protein
MKRIGLISDTHGWIHPGMRDFFSSVDEIWHCGDIGSTEVAEELEAFRPLQAVYGNIDGWDIRTQYPRYRSFICEDIKVLLTHIGGYPGRYEPDALLHIRAEKPDIFACGHSHILKVMNDKQNGLLHINPGAAGKYGLHQKITFIRFEISGKNIQKMEISEYPKEAQQKRL